MDFKGYIEKKLLGIEDLNERSIIRTAVQETILELHRTVQENASRLEEKVLKEERVGTKQYEVEIGIVERDKYDVIDKKMSPILMRDLYEPIISYQEVSNALVNHTELYLFSIFIQADYMLLERLIRTRKQFTGVIETDDGEYSAIFILKPSTEYSAKVKELYGAFVENGVKWNTPCSVYLNKMFNVILIGGDEVEGEDIRNITIDFEEYSSMIRYNIFPIWNIRYTKEKSSLFPIPCEGGKLYQHKIFKERLKSTDCLAVHDRARVYNMYRQEDDLIIVSDFEEITDWTLINFMQERTGYYEEPIFTNYIDSWGNNPVRTMAELKKYVKNIGYTSYISLTEIKKVSEDVIQDQMYLMDDFLLNDLMVAEGGTVLLFSFKEEQSNNYLNRDIMSYIMTRVQWECPQYKCVGILQ